MGSKTRFILRYVQERHYLWDYRSTLASANYLNTSYVYATFSLIEHNSAFTFFESATSNRWSAFITNSSQVRLKSHSSTWSQQESAPCGIAKCLRYSIQLNPIYNNPCPGMIVPFSSQCAVIMPSIQCNPSQFPQARHASYPWKRQHPPFCPFHPL
jgi:hypothetical protein